MVRTAVLSVLIGLELVAAQSLAYAGTDSHPAITTYTCTKKNGCKKQTSYIVLDSAMHPTYQKKAPSIGCGDWGAPPNKTVCPDAKTCAQNCVIEPIKDYSQYGVKTSGSALYLDMLRDDLSTISPRAYLLDSDRHKYDMLKLTGNEFSFDVDVSKLPCGMNGALYLSEMNKYGGKSSLNKVGAELGGGYCDAQCFTFPFLEGVGNIEGKGACCNEMDIWEANSRSNAFVPHPCNITGVYPGNPAESAFEGVCDKWGCGYNPYGVGQPQHYGRGAPYAVDTTRPFTVVTSFPADQKGKLVRIERKWVQDGKIIENAVVNIPGRVAKNYLDDAYCEENPGGTRRFTELGGNEEMGNALSRGMVLAFSVWWDVGGFMDWLDGTASNAGPCNATEGNPEVIKKIQPDVAVTFSEIKWGEIGSTFKVNSDTSDNLDSSSRYFNPVLPGWHSDPSCIYVSEHKTFYCATSTFIVTPGIPIFASKDLTNWKLISHVLNRREQVPSFLETTSDQSAGIYAPTLRYHDGKFYLVTAYVYGSPRHQNVGLVFSTSDPYNSSTWSIPFTFDAAGGIDPDLFWDDANDGQAYLAATPITIRTIDLEKGIVGEQKKVWEGTGGIYPEGPHIYWKDGFYYLLIGEGGTELNHSVTMARSKSIWGPYESSTKNPVLTARGTKNYFQTVGHADLFQDGEGNWWGIALATRSGPDWLNYPMGRESVLFPVEWEEGGWPVIDEVVGDTILKHGRQLPAVKKDIEKGCGPWLSDNNEFEFTPGSQIPPHLSFWRWQNAEAWAISPPENQGTLKVTPSKIITSSTGNNGMEEGISVLLRVQTDTLFTYSVDVDFAPQKDGDEAGVTVWLTQSQHIDLGIVGLKSQDTGRVENYFRIRAVTIDSLPYAEKPGDVVQLVPDNWVGRRLRLKIQAKNDVEYTFSASLSENERTDEDIILGNASASIVSGGSGKFSGTLVGLYATSNGGEGKAPAYFSRWRYSGNGQKIDHDQIVDSW